MFSRFTQKAIQVIMYAQEKAKKQKMPFINNELLLYGIMKVDDPIIPEALSRIGSDKNEFIRVIQKKLSEQKGNQKNDNTPFSPQAKLTLSQAWDEARQLGHNHVSIEHLFLAILKDTSASITALIVESSIDILRIRTAILDILGEQVMQETQQENEAKPQTPTLDQYSLDLTQLAKDDRLDPVIGRQPEIKRILQILSRRNKNNPVLTGEAGVGKTAIIEGLAQRIIANDVPPNLLKKRVVTLDLGLLVAGTRFRGEFEERIKKILDEVRVDRNTILFIDEIHTIIGTGNSEGALDAANLLKPALARGEIQCIGATTLNEYRKSIENDAALERRFQSILVDPPSEEETLEILKGIKRKYEEYHAVQITEEALDAAVFFSTRFITNRQLPDKAVDLIDEACSTEIIEATKQTGKPRKGPIMITKDSVVSVVSTWTGIPLNELSQSETARLKNMANDLSKVVIGQKQAIEFISKSIKRTKAGLKNPHRPTGSFLFLGPSGVGKTELAKQLAKLLFGKEDMLVRIDMSEYTEKHTVSRLVGSPPGYVGYNEGGLLTEPVRKKPYSIVLFDEIEKAHPEVSNLLLQVMEDGRLTDSSGKTVDFRNTVIIMTSNVGAKFIENNTGLGFSTGKQEDSDYERMKDRIMGEVKEAFSPEFINRIDDLIIFRSLTKEDLKLILLIFIDDLNDRLKTKAITVILNPAAKAFLVDKAFEAHKGARPLRKVVQDFLEDRVADLLIDRQIKEHSSVQVGIKNGELHLVGKLNAAVISSPSVAKPKAKPVKKV